MFETRSLVVLSCVCQTDWARSFQGFLCLYFPSRHRDTEITDKIQLSVGSEDSSSSAAVCEARTFPTVSSPQVHIHISFTATALTLCLVCKSLFFFFFETGFPMSQVGLGFPI